MANLSNINGKFVVEQTTGYVGVGTTDPNYPIEVLNAAAEIALNASGASIYRLRSDNTDSFRINKNGVGDRLVIAGNGNATFSGNVNAGGSPSITPNTNFDTLVVTESAHSGITILSGNTSDGGIYFGDPDFNGAGQIKYLHASNSMTFTTDNDNATLTLDDGYNATFAGTISTVGASTFILNDGVFIKAVNGTNNVAATNVWGYGLYEGTSKLGEISLVRDGSNNQMYMGTTGANQVLRIGSANKVTALTIDASQNATFAGNITTGTGSTVSGMATLRLENGTNKRNLSCDGSGNLDISNAANNTTIFHLQDNALTLGTSVGAGSLSLYAGTISANGNVLVSSGGLTVGATSQVAGTQVAIVGGGSTNLQRWGSTSDGGSQASYRFRIDQSFKFIANNGGGDNLTIDSSNGSIIPNGGIYLGGTATAHRLNFYKTDTWAPQIYYQNATDQANATNSTQTGIYTKIGNVCTVQFRLIWNQASGTPAVDNIGIKNLPFGGNTTQAFAEVPCILIGYTGGPSPRGNLTLTLPGANQTLALFNDTNNIGNMGNAIGSGTKEIRFSFTYLTN